MEGHGIDRLTHQGPRFSLRPMIMKLITISFLFLLFCQFFVSSVDDFGLGLLLKTQQVCYKFSEIRLTKWFYPRWDQVGGFSSEFLVGVCGLVLQTLILFQTKM